MCLYSHHIVKIAPKALLLVYSIIPTSLVIVAVDIIFLDRKLSNSIELNPDNYPLFTLIFTLPHILSSYFGFFDKEYIQTYGKKLVQGARNVVIGSIIVSLIDLRLAFYIFALYTMYHVFRQQSGISRSLIGRVGPWYQTWEWLGVAISFVIYMAVYADYREKWTIYAFLLPLALYGYYGYKTARSTKNTAGNIYFILTFFIPIVSGLFFALGYPLLTLAIPRVIHDITAYMFYVTHDHNRFLTSGNNYLYRFAGKLFLPVVLVNPLLSIGLAYLLQTGTITSGSITLMILFLFHYYFEGFIWKKGSLHRQYIHISS